MICIHVYTYTKLSASEYTCKHDYMYTFPVGTYVNLYTCRHVCYTIYMIISVVNSKGGVGKTTTCMYLAAAAAKQNPDREVYVLDCDPQRSASDWWNFAASVGDEPRFSVVTEVGEVADEDLLLIDTAPGSGADIGNAVAAADLVIVPTEAETMSMLRAKKTLDAVGDRGWLLLTKARRRTRLWADTVSAISEAGVRCFDTSISDAVRYKGFAANPNDLGEYTDLWLEIRSVQDLGRG